MSLCNTCKKRKICLIADDNPTVYRCVEYKPKTSDVITDGLKHDGGKPMLALVPSAIIRAVGRVMTHGAEKYGKNSYRDVDPERYRHALMRHICEWLDDPYGVDKDSGLPHLEHIACNVAFLLELDKEKKNEG